MPTIFKSQDLQFREDKNSIDNFRIQTADPRLSRVVKSEHLFFDIRLLNPGQFSFPYHYHRHAEELIFIISGSLTLRTSKGLQVLYQGDLAFFEMEESGAHQFFNHTNETCTYLDIKTAMANDICEYPDSNKISVSPYSEIYEKKDRVDYFKGEENIRERWEKLKNNKETLSD